jgi:hypothetical protein
MRVALSAAQVRVHGRLTTAHLRSSLIPGTASLSATFPCFKNELLEKQKIRKGALMSKRKLRMKYRKYLFSYTFETLPVAVKN